jgi:hypothetical protein
VHSTAPTLLSRSTMPRVRSPHKAAAPACDLPAGSARAEPGLDAAVPKRTLGPGFAA